MATEFSLLSPVIESLPSNLVAQMLSLGVCPRCIFRFLGCHDDVYSDSSLTRRFIDHIISKRQENSTNLEAVDEKSHNVLCSSGSSKPCVVCLGILDLCQDDVSRVDQGEDNVPSYKTQIITAVNDQGHRFSDFCLEMTIPGVILVRERALWQHLQDHCDSESYFQGKQVSKHVVALKEALKWVLINVLEKSLEASYDSGSAFRVSLNYKHSESSNELDCLGCSVPTSGKRKRNGSNDGNDGSSGQTESLAAIQRSLASLSPGDLSDIYPWPPPKRSTYCELSVTCNRTSIYIGGRYLKFSRNLSQSPWMIDDERMGDGSVQEIIADVIFPHFKADSYKFHAAGREDIDVRMLGNGRPFILELFNARILLANNEIQKLEESINDSKEGWVKVRNVQLVGNDAWMMMLEGESEKQKEYTAVIWLSRHVKDSELSNITSMKELEIQQKTPVRVLHRRSPLVRPRIIYWIQLKRIAGTEQYFLLQLCTQAGTYVKEFVHGDLGRTYPNVGSLFGCEAEILQLDVTDIKMDLFH